MVKEYKKPTKKEKLKSTEVKKLDDDLIQKICNLIRLGSSLDTALGVTSVRKETFKYWMKVGQEKPRSIHAELIRSIHRAAEAATIRDLQVIDNAAQGLALVYERYPKGTKMPIRDAKGNIEYYPANHKDPTKAGEPILIDVSDQVVMDDKGKPVVQRPFVAPNWTAAAWKLSRRKPMLYGTDPEPDALIDGVQNGDEIIEVEFVNMSVPDDIKKED